MGDNLLLGITYVSHILRIQDMLYKRYILHLPYTPVRGKVLENRVQLNSILSPSGIFWNI
jgi:hypothetical protein